MSEARLQTRLWRKGGIGVLCREIGQIRRGLGWEGCVLVAERSQAFRAILLWYTCACCIMSLVKPHVWYSVKLISQLEPATGKGNMRLARTRHKKGSPCA